MGMQIEEVSHSFKQASHQWFLKFDQVVTFFCFNKMLWINVYLHASGSKFIILVLCVDDTLLASNNVGLPHETNKQILSKTFEMKDLSKASFVLGIEIHGDRSRDMLELSQRQIKLVCLNNLICRGCSLAEAPMLKMTNLLDISV